MYKTLTLSAALLLPATALAVPNAGAVLSHYADLAQAEYQDALTTAQALKISVDQLVAQPSEAKLISARNAWIAARKPYQQTEVYRFGNAIVDDWEGRINAWPLDEGLIDYVAASYGTESDENQYYASNVIANPQLVLSGRTIDASEITPKLLAETLHEVDEIESNVATGYHAVEFLLWGQDLNGTNAGAGNRPASDFDPANCTGGNCDRRAAYLQAATELMIEDLSWMVSQWENDGAARKVLLDGDLTQGLAAIFTGIGSLSYGELAGERMKLGLMLHDPEEEHDCFSDQTHYSHYYDALGMLNVYTGSYTRIDGSVLHGPAVSDLVAAKDPKLDATIRKDLTTTVAKMQVLVDSAEQDGIAYDQLIAAGNKDGNAKIMAAINALRSQTQSVEKAVTLLGLTPIAFEGSDSLDHPGSIN